MAGASENHKVLYNPKTVPKPHEELQRLVFLFIGRCSNSLHDIYASYPRPTDFGFLDFVDRGKTVLLQDFSQLVNIGRTHILFYRAVFKTGLFLKYK